MSSLNATDLTQAPSWQRPLPPPRRVAIPENIWCKRLLGLATRKLACRELENADVRYVARTRTCVDVGGWFGPRPIQLAVTPRELVLVADGMILPSSRPVVIRIRLRDLKSSVYNHITGRLALSPAPSSDVKALKVDPITGYQILSQIHHEGT